MAELIKMISPNPISGIYIIIVILVLIWMYKELRSNQVESDKNDQIRADKALDNYAELENALYKYLNDSSDFAAVTDKMAKATSLLTYDLLSLCVKSKEKHEAASRLLIVKELLVAIQTRMMEIKKMQTDGITFKSGNVFEQVMMHIKTKIVPLWRPLLYTFLNILGLQVLFIFILKTSNQSFYMWVLNYSLVFVVVTYFCVLYPMIIEVILKKRFINTVLNWSLFALIIVTPPIFFFIGPWYRGLIMLPLMILYVIYVAKRGVIRTTPAT